MNYSLFEAIYQNNLNLFQKLIDQDFHIKQKEKNEYCLLYEAVSYNRFEMVQLLLEHGVNVNNKSDFGTTPLLAACYCNVNINIMKLLLNFGAEINAQNNAGWTALHSSCFDGSLDKIELLLLWGADSRLKTNRSETIYDLLSLDQLKIKNFIYFYLKAQELWTLWELE